jgi:hypothetical protein
MDEMTTVAESTAPVVVLEHGPFELTTTGVNVLKQPTYEEWAAVFKWAHSVDGAVQFWLGDLLAIGESNWGEKYTQALETTGYAEQTLRNAVYVARAIAPDRRRSPDVVSFAHHAEVAAMSPEQQEYWLKICEEEHLTREQLRRRIKKAIAEQTGHIAEFWLIVRCTNAEDQEQLCDKLRAEGRTVKLK